MKNQSHFLLILFLGLALFSCEGKKQNKIVGAAQVKEKHKEDHKKDKAHWSYMGETGPEHWAEIEKNSHCDGNHQSPINIVDVGVTDDASLQAIDVHYSDNVKIHEVTNNGHSIQYNFEEGDFIMLKDKKYELKQIHFHEPSEHTINGIRYPLEMHLVHVSKDNQISVLSVLAKEGENSKPFEFLEKYLPIQNGETKPIGANFDLNDNLPQNKAYYTYSGSLTTPPCTENVNWFIFKEPVTVSVDQVKQLQKLMPLNNYRNEQAINDRTIRLYSKG